MFIISYHMALRCTIITLKSSYELQLLVEVYAWTGIRQRIFEALIQFIITNIFVFLTWESQLNKSSMIAWCGVVHVLNSNYWPVVWKERYGQDGRSRVSRMSVKVEGKREWWGRGCIDGCHTNKERRNGAVRVIQLRRRAIQGKDGWIRVRII
mgnify:CR=1 FL=1